jgi:hypothetical protein
MLDMPNCHQQEGLDAIELSYDREIAQFTNGLQTPRRVHAANLREHGTQSSPR